MGRIMPVECEHGVVVDGGDFCDPQVCAKCEQERDAKAVELEALRADRNRLEWFVMQGEALAKSNKTGLWYVQGFGCEHQETWRDAIDEAMKDG